MEENIDSISEVVIDASVVLNFLMPDEATPAEVDKIFESIKQQKVKAFAPEILNYEVANSLRSAVLSKRTIQKIALSIFNDFGNLGVNIRKVDYLNTLDIAIKENLSVYDASYVCLASSLEIALISFDGHMTEVAKKAIQLKPGKN